MEHRTTEAQGRPDPSDPEPTRSRPRSGVLALLGPGILVAATGVGAGDLATGAIAGSRLGVAVLWAALLGAGLKYLLTEGLARWQLATGTTVLEGAVTHFGRVVQWAFLGYLLLWSYFVGAALMSACGIAAHALVPVLDARGDKIAYGLLHSAAALALL
ncbi:MAG: Nramp family divalent metal transporter, partial [Planctomycetota bacterium]